MALAGEIMRYIGNEFVPMATKTASSSLSSVIPSAIAKTGAGMATKAATSALGNVTNKAISNAANKAIEKSVLQNIGGRIFQNGKPKSFYHGSPNPNIDKLDLSKAGSNTQSGENVLYFTDDYPTAEEFSYERLPSNSMFINNRGKKGKVYEKQLDLKNLVDLGNLSDEQIGNLYEYADAINRYDGKEKFIQRVKEDLLAGNDQSIKTRLDLNALKNSDYDGFIAKMYPNQKGLENVREYGVFNPDNVRDVRHIPINQVSNTEEVPVSTLRSLFRGQLYSDTDFSYNSPSMNSGDSSGSQALGGAYHFTPDESKANAWADNAGGGVIKIGYKPDQLLKAEDAKRMIQEAADKLNDGAYMSKLWQTDPELAEQIELVGIGNLEALAKREGKPFVEHINANDNELGTIYYYKDVDEGLTEKFREQFRKTKAEKYLGKPKVQQSLVSPDERMSYGYGGGYSSYDDNVKRIGSSEVATVREETLPSGWKELEKYMDTSNDRLSLAIGKPRSKITKQDLIDFLVEYGYEAEGTKDELWKNALMCIDDMAVDDLYNAGGSAGGFLQNRLPFRHSDKLTDATNYYIGAKGRTGRLDAEFSDRLGIGRSNTPMSDSLVNPYSAAGGDYAGGAIGTNANWATGENGVSTTAHERLHAWQDINKYDWDEEVVDAIDELRGELKKFYHDVDTIKKYWGNSKTDYYSEDVEQEARMLQSYLDNEGYTNTTRKNSEKGTEWGDEIKPAFDRFFKKLRALSKKGVALPAIAGLFGLGALAGKKDDKSIDNIK